MVTDEKREGIRKEARRILDSFVSALEKVEIKEEKIKKNVGGFREEGEGEKGNDDFRKRMFDNAPKTEGDCILAEKKKW